MRGVGTPRKRFKRRLNLLSTPVAPQNERIDEPRRAVSFKMDLAAFSRFSSGGDMRVLHGAK